MTAPNSFVPLTATPTSSAQREFKVAIINGHDHAAGDVPPQKTGFQALDTQRVSPLGGTGNSEKKVGEPRVTVQRDGDRVTHLRIQCTCGLIMDIACVYDPSASPAA